VAEQGRDYAIELRSRAVRRAGAADRALLGTTRGRILAIKCLHKADRRPYALESRLINLDAVPAAETADFAAEPPGSWLLAHVSWTEAEHRISAVDAGAEIAAALELPFGQACLSLERWTWRGDERITYARQIYPGASYSLVAHFRP
jgi:GntR family histidine utilization transcriptional repressor